MKAIDIKIELKTYPYLIAISKFVLKTIKTIDRPAISGLMPTMKGLTVVLDLGANVECSNDNLVQFALMGDIFAKCVLGIKKPKIGLLNVGTEDIKGNPLVKQAYENLKRIVQLAKDLQLPSRYRGPVRLHQAQLFQHQLTKANYLELLN